MTTREYAEHLFRQALAAVDVPATMAANLSCDGTTLRIRHLQYQLNQYDSIVVVAAGKAALPMTDALAKVVLPRLLPYQQLQGVVVTGTLPPEPLPHLRYYVGGHPIPNETSRIAAEDALSLLAKCNQRSLVLFLISGGASAMLEKPLNPDISVDDTASFYKALVHSGLPIVQMNTLRKHFSAVKGGRLAQAAELATQCTIIVSDVPEGSLDMVGSGPSLPDTSTTHDCRRILASTPLAHNLPRGVVSLLLAPGLPETPKSQDLAFVKASHLCLLSNADLLREAAALAAADGHHVVIDNSCDDYNYEKAGAYLLDQARALSFKHPKLCLLSGGEISVRLPAEVGIGGRNQQFAMWCALQMQKTRERITVLSAGTDGLDGNSPAAGAIVDNNTCEHGERLGLSPQAYLRQYDSFTFLDAVGAALITGPTYTNIRDLRILLIDPETSRSG